MAQKTRKGEKEGEQPVPKRMPVVGPDDPRYLLGWGLPKPDSGISGARATAESLRKKEEKPGLPNPEKALEATSTGLHGKLNPKEEGAKKKKPQTD